MNKELIIDSSSTEVSIALLEDKKLVELHKEREDSSFSVGDIFYGKISKIIPGLNAAFVNIGYEKEAFLHYQDLGPKFTSLNKFIQEVINKKLHSFSLNQFELQEDIDKNGKITDVLSQNQSIVVQIAKEPISTKGPRLNSELSIAGRYLILLPFSERVSVSQKIVNKEERERLKRLIQSIKPKNLGVIIRTIAENKKVADLNLDLKDLLKRWENTCKELQKAKPPKKLLGELNRTSTLLRDLLNTTFSNIYINDNHLYEATKNYLKTIAPEQEKIVKLYKGNTPIFDNFGINKQIISSFGKYVTTTGGVYLVIEHTEALHAIDVNSGNKTKEGNDQESIALEVNLTAAIEVARQLRLRDMGGIIVIDFIDMKKIENRKILYEKLKEVMNSDRARHNIIAPSKFGLVQITRQRVRPEMAINTAEKCPCCKGTGEIQPSVLLINEIENKLQHLLKGFSNQAIILKTHPFVASYLKKNLCYTQWRWFFKFKKWIPIQSSITYHILEYHFFNKKGEDIM